MQAVIGIITILGVGFLLCKDRSLIQWRFIAIGLVLQFALATLFLKVAWIAESLMVFNVIVTAIEQATLVGTSFMFGFLGGADAPFDLKSGPRFIFSRSGYCLKFWYSACWSPSFGTGASCPCWSEF